MKPFFILALTCLIGAFQTAAAAGRDPYVAIYDDVLQANADRAVERCTDLQQRLGEPSAERRHDAFVALAQAWARVEASYILGGYDMDAMDYPLMVDYFHLGKEDVHATLARLIEGDAPPARALYKNSYKTIGALDDVLFSGPWSPRREALAEVIAATVCRNLTRIRDGYRAHRADYLEDPKKALSLLINAEIENLYKTRDWRIAQISGLTKQTLGKPEPHHQQYPYSEASWAAIGAIIATHRQLLAEDRQPNLATIAHRQQADAGLATIQAALRATEQAYRDTPPDHHFGTREMIPIFQGLLDMQKAFYRQLVGRLGVTAAIIDADGD
ncbi:hypothetical protein [Endothiovibrio diazotrophicus]